MRFDFAGYSIEEGGRILLNGSRPIKIERQAAQMLVHLIQHRDRIVPKEELIELLWDGDSVSESSLPRCMSALRSTFRERIESGQPIIETTYGQGYRFVSPVEIVDIPLSPPSTISPLRISRRREIHTLKSELASALADPNEAGHRWLKLADLETRDGLIKDARSSILAAVVQARASEDFELIGRAAIALAGTYIFTHRNDFLVSLLTEALQGISDQNLPLSLELKSERELALLGPKDGVDSRREVLQILRDSEVIDDLHTRVRVLILSHRALDTPGALHERRMLSDEALAITNEVEEPKLYIEALNARLNDAIGIGDLKDYDLTCKRIQGLAESIDEALWLARAAMANAVLTYLRGDYTRSVEFRDEALCLIEENPEDHQLFMCIHGFMIGREQPENLLKALPGLGIELNRDPVSEVLIELGSLYLGFGGKLESEFRPLSTGWIQKVDRRFGFMKLVAIATCAEVAFLRDDVLLAERLTTELLEISESMTSMAAYACLEPREYFLALAETVIGSFDSADQNFSYATTLCQRLEAPAFEARVSFAWATMLMRRTNRDDESAHEKASFAYQTARRLGMTRLESEARALLEKSWPSKT